MNKKTIIILFSFILFVAITVHHVIVCGRIFDLVDMLHHEIFSFVFLAFGIGLTIGAVLE